MRLNGIGASNLFNVRIASRRIVGDSSKQDTLHCNRSKVNLSEIQCRTRHHAKEIRIFQTMDSNYPENSNTKCMKLSFISGYRFFNAPTQFDI